MHARTEKHAAPDEAAGDSLEYRDGRPATYDAIDPFGDEEGNEVGLTRPQPMAFHDAWGAIGR
jgi:hypothetical protein